MAHFNVPVNDAMRYMDTVCDEKVGAERQGCISGARQAHLDSLYNVQRQALLRAAPLSSQYAYPWYHVAYTYQRSPTAAESLPVYCLPDARRGGFVCYSVPEPIANRPTRHMCFPPPPQANAPPRFTAAWRR